MEKSLDKMVPRLLERFSSKEGYKLFEDSLPCRRCVYGFCTTQTNDSLLVQSLKAMNIQTGLVSNTDSRMREFILCKTSDGLSLRRL